MIGGKRVKMLKKSGIRIREELEKFFRQKSLSRNLCEGGARLEKK